MIEPRERKLTKKNYGRKISRDELERMAAEVDFAREARIAMIQQLIPLGLMAVEGDQKVKINVPRIRELGF